jgi:hypothetical protein
MNSQNSRRRFLAGLLATLSTVTLGAAHAEDATPPQEYYEIRIYRCPTAEKQQAVVNYVETALLPALNRQKIDRVGIFTPTGENADNSVYVLIPYRTLDMLGGLNAALAADSDYQSAAADYFATPVKDSAYTRIESRLMKAFAGMPVLEQPDLRKPQRSQGSA